MIRSARFPEEIEILRTLFREYQADIGVDLCFQSFEVEIAGLPGDYAPPRGALLCLETDAGVVGCVALRPLVKVGDGAAEMKRLFVRPAHRGGGAGRALVVDLIRRAKEIGYARIYLDTIPGMERAQALYASLGFVDVPAYTPNPIAGVRYMALAL